MKQVRSDKPTILLFRDTIALLNPDGTKRYRNITLTIDVAELWRELAYKAAASKTGRAVIGGGAVKATRQGSR